MTPNTKKRRPGRRRRIALRVAGGFITLLVVAAISLLVAVECSRKPFRAPVTAGWRTGDIFFSSGNSCRSLFVRMFGGDSADDVTHCGFVVIMDGEIKLVHMSTDKNEIAVEGVDEYGEINDVYRITARRLTMPVDTATLRLNIEKLIADRKKFDNSFDHDNPDEYYCTEFVIRELQKVNIKVFDPLLSNEHVYPADIEMSAFVKPI